MKNQHIEFNTSNNKFLRISWGAILAGTLTVLVVLFLLNLLGLGIGLTTINPVTENNPLDGLGTGTIIWWAISNVAALFIGGMVAGRMSGLTSNSDGGLHGFLAWGLYTVLSIFLVTSAAGGIFNSFANTTYAIFSDSMSTNLAEELKSALDRGRDETTYSVNEIKQEAFQLINKAEKRNILPSSTSQQVKSAINTVEQEAEELLNELNLDENIEKFFNDISIDLDNNGNLSITGVNLDKDEILNGEEIKKYLAQNTDLSEAEIDGVIEKWNRKINRAIEKAEQYYEKIKKEAVQLADEAADQAGKYAIIAFFLLLLGAGAAFSGGVTGSPLLSLSEEHKKELSNKSNV